MYIRTATMEDLERVTAAEAESFPTAEAATRESFQKRLSHYGDHFWLLFDGDRLVSFVNGMVTDISDLADEMYQRAELHDEKGAWQMIFGVVTVPEYRRQGCAEEVLRHAIREAERQGRAGLVLTCKETLIHYYAKFGFRDEGVAHWSDHGGAVWNQMRLTFSK